MSAAAWGGAFLLSAIAEEFLYRGYAQFTLTTGIGFWPAAAVLSALFGLGHLGNKGENIFGAFSVVSFGLLLCLFLRRTGTLWCAVGFHLGYDWGQTFFYGVPNSGFIPSHNLFNVTLHGSHWLTGGTVGPEASVICPLVLAVVAILFSLRHREARYQASDSSVEREPSAPDRARGFLEPAGRDLPAQADSYSASDSVERSWPPGWSESMVRKRSAHVSASGRERRFDGSRPIGPPPRPARCKAAVQPSDRG